MFSKAIFEISIIKHNFVQISNQTRYFISKKKKKLISNVVMSKKSIKNYLYFIIILY
jgi:hypothetical protein